MGEVWRAVHRATGRPVALKVIRADRASQAPFVEAYERELRAVASLDHPRVVDVLASGVAPPTAERIRGPWFAMELARGTLAERPVDDFAGLVAAIDPLLAGLAHAHARGLLHRDVKPANVLDCGIGRRPHWKLADFGLARLPGIRSMGGGTPGYLAPEQATGGHEGPWTDLYAVGAVAWTLICGEPPIRTSFAPRFAVPRALVAWLDRLLAADAAARWDRAADARAALRAIGRDTREHAPSAPDAAAWIEPGAPPTLVPQADPSSTFLFPDDDDPAGGEPEPPPAPEPAPRPAPVDPPRPPPPDWRTADPPDFVFSVPQRLRLQVGGWSLAALRPLPLVGRDEHRDALWRLLERAQRDRTVVRVVLAGPEGVGRARLARWLAETADELGVADAEGTRGRPALRLALDVDRDPGALAGWTEPPACAAGQLLVATAGPGWRWPGAERIEVGPLDWIDWRMLGGLLGLSGVLQEELEGEVLSRPGVAVRIVLAGLEAGTLQQEHGRLVRRGPLPLLDGDEAALEAVSAADPGAFDALGLAIAVPVPDEVYAAACASLGVAPADRRTLAVGAARAALARGRASGRWKAWCAALADVLPPTARDGRALATAGAERPEAIQLLTEALSVSRTREIPGFVVASTADALLEQQGVPASDPRRGWAAARLLDAWPIETRAELARRLIDAAVRFGWPPRLEAFLRVELAGIHRERGRVVEALEQAEAATAISARAGLESLERRALSSVLLSLCNVGRPAEALPLLDRYDALAAGDPIQMAFGLYYRAFVVRRLGDAAQWEALLRRLEAMALDDPNLAAGTHVDLGECERQAGRLDRAVHHYRTAARFSRHLMTSELAYANLALVHVARGDWAAAEAIALQARWGPARRVHPLLGAAFAQIEALLAAHSGDLPAFDAAWEEFEEILAGSGLVDHDFADLAEQTAAALDAAGAPERAARARKLAQDQRARFQARSGRHRGA